MKLLLITTIALSLATLGGVSRHRLNTIRQQPVTTIHKKHLYFSGSARPSQWSGLELKGAYSGYITTTSQQFTSGGYQHHTAQLVVNLATGQSHIDLQVSMDQYEDDLFVRITEINTSGPLTTPVHALVLLLKQYQDIDLLLDTPVRKQITRTVLSPQHQHHRGKRLDHISYTIIQHTTQKRLTLKLPELPKRFILTSSLG